jgi:hypothetical protein
MVLSFYYVLIWCQIGGHHIFSYACLPFTNLCIVSFYKFGPILFFLRGIYFTLFTFRSSYIFRIKSSNWYAFEKYFLSARGLYKILLTVCPAEQKVLIELRSTSSSTVKTSLCCCLCFLSFKNFLKKIHIISLIISLKFH